MELQCYCNVDVIHVFVSLCFVLFVCVCVQRLWTSASFMNNLKLVSRLHFKCLSAFEIECDRVQKPVSSFQNVVIFSALILSNNNCGALRLRVIQLNCIRFGQKSKIIFILPTFDRRRKSQSINWILYDTKLSKNNKISAWFRTLILYFSEL